jgi:hypothetical protein
VAPGVSGSFACTAAPGRVCDRYVGPDASLLVAGFYWLYLLQPDAEHAGQRRAGELSRSGAGHLAHSAQPDRCHLSSVIVKMILVTYKFDVHPPPVRDTMTVVPLCYRRVMAVRKKRSISIPPELDAAIAAAAQDAGLSYSAWITQTARKEFIIQAGLEAVSKYEAEHGPFNPDEIAEADEWAARITQPPATRRTA